MSECRVWTIGNIERGGEQTIQDKAAATEQTSIERLPDALLFHSVIAGRCSGRLEVERKLLRYRSGPPAWLVNAGTEEIWKIYRRLFTR